MMKLLIHICFFWKENLCMFYISVEARTIFTGSLEQPAVIQHEASFC